jgi:hypothetical protein
MQSNQKQPGVFIPARFIPTPELVSVQYRDPALGAATRNSTTQLRTDVRRGRTGAVETGTPSLHLGRIRSSHFGPPWLMLVVVIPDPLTCHRGRPFTRRPASRFTGGTCALPGRYMNLAAHRRAGHHPLRARCALTVGPGSPLPRTPHGCPATSYFCGGISAHGFAVATDPNRAVPVVHRLLPGRRASG